MATTTENDAIAGRIIPAQGTGYFMMILHITRKQFGCAFLAMPGRPLECSDFDLGGKFLSHFASLATATHTSLVGLGIPPRT